MRVASRRLRSVLPLFATTLSRQTWARWRKQLRRVTRGPGAARDTDVQMACVQQFLHDRASAEEQVGVKRLLLRLEQRRQALQEPVVKALERFAARQLAEEMEERLKQVASEKRVVWSRRAGPAGSSGDTQRHPETPQRLRSVWTLRRPTRVCQGVTRHAHRRQAPALHHAGVGAALPGPVGRAEDKQRASARPGWVTSTMATYGSTPCRAFWKKNRRARWRILGARPPLSRYDRDFSPCPRQSPATAGTGLPGIRDVLGPAASTGYVGAPAPDARRSPAPRRRPRLRRKQQLSLGDGALAPTPQGIEHPVQDERASYTNRRREQ